VPECMPVRILPAGVLAGITAEPGPADFKPYRDEISGCECTVCVEIAYNAHHWCDKRVRREAARVLLAHLVAGTHERVTLAERAQFARLFHTWKVDTAKAAGVTGETLARIEHPDLYARLDAHADRRDGFMNGIGLGMTPGGIIGTPRARDYWTEQAAKRRAASDVAESVTRAVLAGDSVDQVAEVPTVAEVAPVACAVVALTVDQGDTVPAAPLVEEPVRIVFDEPAPVAPAVAEDSAESAPSGATYGAHPQRVSVSGQPDGDGYRFHLVEGANGRALAKLVKPALARLVKATGAQFYVTAPRKSGTVNVVPHAGHVVTDWAPALALFAEMMGEHIVPATECGACDRSAALVDA
jgi:hypothetical protein